MQNSNPIIQSIMAILVAMPTKWQAMLTPLVGMLDQVLVTLEASHKATLQELDDLNQEVEDVLNKNDRLCHSNRRLEQEKQELCDKHDKLMEENDELYCTRVSGADYDALYRRCLDAEDRNSKCQQRLYRLQDTLQSKQSMVDLMAQAFIIDFCLFKRLLGAVSQGSTKNKVKAIRLLREISGNYTSTREWVGLKEAKDFVEECMDLYR